VTGCVLHTLHLKLHVTEGAVSVRTIQPQQIGIIIILPVWFWFASVLSFPSLAPMLGIRPYEVLQLARVGVFAFNVIPLTETHLFSQQKHSSQSFDSNQRSLKAIEPKVSSSSGPRDMSPSRGTVVSAPSSPPASTSSNKAAPSLSKLNINAKPSFAGFSSNSVVRGIPIAESGAKSSAAAHELSRYCPSACDDGSLVCKRCHDIVMPHEIQSHDSTCESNQNSPLADSRASLLTRSEKVVQCSGAIVQGSKHGCQEPAGSFGSRAQSSQCSGNLFSFSDIQSRFNAKKAALLQKPLSDEVTTSTTRHTASKANPRQLTRHALAQAPLSGVKAPHNSIRSGDSATDRNKRCCKSGTNNSAIGGDASSFSSSESGDSHAQESGARGGDGCTENDFPDHDEPNASSSSDSDMLLISPSRSEDLASVLSPRTRSSRSLLSGSSNAASQKSVANVKHRRQDDGPNPLKLRRIQNGTKTPVLRSNATANSSLTRSATHTDLARCSDQVDCSSSYCLECGLGGGDLLVSRFLATSLLCCHRVNIFLAGMLQAKLLRPLTCYVLWPQPGGLPAKIRVSPLPKPAFKNEITFAVHRLHCCGISGGQ
jgi:hypothetical protein